MNYTVVGQKNATPHDEPAGRSMSKGFLAVLMLLLAAWGPGACALPVYTDPGPQGDDIRVHDQFLTKPSGSAQPYRWWHNSNDRHTIMFEMVAGSQSLSDGSEWDAMNSAVSTWNDAGAAISADTTLYNGSWGALNGDNEVAWVSDYDLWAELGFTYNVPAITRTWYRGNTQLESDIFLNDHRYSWYTPADDNGQEPLYVEHIMLHELGHALSLADLYDNEDSERTMYGYTTPRNEDVTLHPYDEMALRLAYSLPEPSTIALLASALTGLTVIAVRRAR